jgi:hypothetical protein
MGGDGHCCLARNSAGHRPCPHALDTLLMLTCTEARGFAPAPRRAPANSCWRLLPSAGAGQQLLSWQAGHVQDAGFCPQHSVVRGCITCHGLQADSAWLCCKRAVLSVLDSGGASQEGTRRALQDSFNSMHATHRGHLGVGAGHCLWYWSWQRCLHPQATLLLRSAQVVVVESWLGVEVRVAVAAAQTAGAAALDAATPAASAASPHAAAAVSSDQQVRGLQCACLMLPASRTQRGWCQCISRMLQHLGRSSARAQLCDRHHACNQP